MRPPDKPVITDLVPENRPSVAVEAAGPRLVLLASGNHPDSPWSQVIPLTGDVKTVVIRRGKVLTVQAHGDTWIALVPDKTVSNYHALVCRQRSGWWIEDTNSRNGTLVNGTPVRKGNALQHRDVVLTGSVAWLFLTTEGPKQPARFGSLYTLHPEMAAIYGALARVAATELPVLLQGPPGSGKSRLARELHRLSRRSGDLTVLNCSTLSPQLAEGILFGTIEGSFTGAKTTRGLMQQASTLFLDEIADLPLATQPKLLRALEEHRVRRVGGAKEEAISCRLVSATNKDLRKCVMDGTFRLDLCQRINTYEASIPTLSERNEDLGMLITALWSETVGTPKTILAPDALLALARHNWPAGVRGLKQALLRGAAFSEDDIIQRSDLGLDLQTEVLQTQPFTPQNLITSLTRTRGIVAEVATEFRTSRAHIYRVCKREGIDWNKYRKK